MNRSWTLISMQKIGMALCLSLGFVAAGCGTESSDLTGEATEVSNPEGYTAQALIEGDKVVTRILDRDQNEVDAFVTDKPNMDGEISLKSAEDSTLKMYLQTTANAAEAGEIGTTTRAYWSGGLCHYNCSVSLYRWVTVWVRYWDYGCQCQLWREELVQETFVNAGNGSYPGAPNQCNTWQFLNWRATAWKNAAAVGGWIAFPGTESCRDL